MLVGFVWEGRWDVVLEMEDKERRNASCEVIFIASALCLSVYRCEFSCPRPERRSSGISGSEISGIWAGREIGREVATRALKGRGLGCHANTIVCAVCRHCTGVCFAELGIAGSLPSEAVNLALPRCLGSCVERELEDITLSLTGSQRVIHSETGLALS